MGAETSLPTETSLRRRAILSGVLRDCGIARSVVVTGSFRSGSSFICTMLANNGLAGTDKERFAGFWDIRPETPDSVFRDRLEGIFGSAEGGIFTTKLMWPHRNFLAGSLGLGRGQTAEFAALFPDARWIDIRRNDRFAQAVSFWKAKITDRWHVFADEAEPEVAYDFKGIRAAFVELSAHELLWADFYRQAGIAPHRIVYEDFQTDVPKGLGALLAALGPAHRRSHPPLTPQTKLRRQRNDQSQQIRDRFLAELYTTGF